MSKVRPFVATASLWSGQDFCGIYKAGGISPDPGQSRPIPRYAQRW
jgi:hypothetical protein